MMTGLSLQQLAAKISSNQELKRDFVVDTRRIRAYAQSAHANEKASILLDVKDHGAFPLLPLAHDQLGGWAGIPSKYYDRMVSEAPGLLVANVNTWLDRKPASRMVRTLGGDARAFLSNKYQRIENEQIAEAALPVLAELPGVQIVSSEVTDRRLYIQFVLPTIEGEVKKGDIVQAGGIISNSEVGLGSASVSALIWRLACLNGMKTGETYRKYHVGRAADEGEMVWAEDTQRSDDRTVLLKIRDMVKSVVDLTKFQTTLNKLRVLAGSPEMTDPVKAVEVLGQKVMLLESEKGGILKSLIKGGDLSAWGLLNAVTAQSHTAVSYDRAVDLEGIGGSLVELSKADWKEVMTAE